MMLLWTFCSPFSPTTPATLLVLSCLVLSCLVLSCLVLSLTFPFPLPFLFLCHQPTGADCCWRNWRKSLPKTPSRLSCSSSSKVPIYLSIYLSIYQPTNQPNNQTTRQPTPYLPDNRPTYLTTKQPTSQPTPTQNPGIYSTS